jgi:hypothetical protein
MQARCLRCASFVCWIFFSCHSVSDSLRKIPATNSCTSQLRLHSASSRLCLFSPIINSHYFAPLRGYEEAIPCIRFFDPVDPTMEWQVFCPPLSFVLANLGWRGTPVRSDCSIHARDSKCVCVGHFSVAVMVGIRSDCDGPNAVSLLFTLQWSTSAHYTLFLFLSFVFFFCYIQVAFWFVLFQCWFSWFFFLHSDWIQYQSKVESL